MNNPHANRSSSRQSANAAPEKRDFSDDNRSWPYIKGVLAPLGLSVVVIETKGDARNTGIPHIGNLIGAELELAKLGTFDSAKIETSEVTRWFYLVSAENLSEALRRIRKTLHYYKLLPIAKIRHADVETAVWRTFHPSPGGQS